MGKKHFKILFPIFVLIIISFVFYVLFNFKELDFVGGSTKKISTLIVPHDEFAKSLRDDAIGQVAKTIKPETIIVVSTNHFYSGNQNILSTEKTWKIYSGNVEPDINVIENLKNSSVLSVQDSPFEREHGIYNLLAPLKKYFNSAKIVPIIIKNGTSQEKLQELNSTLVDYCNNCLFVASIDFSHYQLGSLADLHDALSLRSLYSQSENLAFQTESDSPETLALAIMWAKSKDTRNFKLFKNTNSGQILNQSDVETTSYILGWYDSGVINANQKEEITFMIAGDTMLGRAVYYRYPNLEKVFEKLGNKFFCGTDVSMVNLEGPIVVNNFNPNPDPNSLIFKFPPQTGKILKNIHVNLAALANNHTLNQGGRGFTSTLDILKKSGIFTVGNPTKVDTASLYINNSGTPRLAIVNISAIDSEPDINEIIKDEKQLGSKIIVFVHWGNEYQKTHSPAQERLAHLWINHGADLVIGTHPHIIQDAELYEGKPIFYSIGNFVFDQTFSKETQTGLVIAGKISNNSMKIVLIPIDISNFQPKIFLNETRRNIITSLKKQFGYPTQTFEYGYDTIKIDF